MLNEKHSVLGDNWSEKNWIELSYILWDYKISRAVYRLIFMNYMGAAHFDPELPKIT